MTPEDCWLHPDLEVRSSPISGQGLFALAPIPAGTVVSRLGGTLVSTAELDELMHGPRYIDTITVADGVHLVLPPDTPNGKGNHSCDPNLWWVDAFTLATRLDVLEGEEVTNDYATSTAESGFRMPCRCGAESCRGEVSGGDWRRAELRERYGRHWVPAVLDLIDG